MTGHPVIAIVILNWNGVPLLRRFLPTVLENSRLEGVKVYVADNGSSDGSPEVLKQDFTQINLIELDRNYGFAEGYNQALRQIEADIFVLLNSDVEVTPGWLEPCIALFKSHQEIAAVQPKILSYSNRNNFEYAGAAGGFIDHWGFPFCRGRILHVVEEDTGQYDRQVSVFWATGACMFIRAADFRQTGGFDGDFFAHMEEIDLCWRLKNRGKQIVFEHRSKVYHQGGATLSYQSPQKVFLNFRNSLWMLLKNLPEGQLIRTLLPRMILDGVAALNFLASGQFFAFRAVWKAHLEFYKTLPEFMRKRKVLLPQVTVNNHSEMFKGSMVFNFYIKKRRKFSEFNFKTI